MEKLSKIKSRRQIPLRTWVVLLLALVFTGVQSVLASNPHEVRQSTGYWRFYEEVTNRSNLPPVGGSVLSADASVSEGHITYSVIYGDPEPSKNILDCTWSLDAPDGLDRLTPGEILHGSMSMTDQSEYYHTYDGFDHGYAGGSGSIYFDQPYIGTLYTDGYRELLNVYVGYQQTVSQEGQLAVPDGPGWDGKIGFKTVCLGSNYERVYEWVPQEEAGIAAPEETAGAGDVPPSPMAPDNAMGWIVVVGGIMAVVAAAIVGAAAVGVGLILRRGKKKTPSIQPSPPKYVLQLSANSLEVLVGKSASLTIQAWRITPEGGTVPAPEASIKVSLPSSPAALVVTPAAGQGTLECVFTTVNPTRCAQVTATITASAGGVGTTAQVEVKLAPAYELTIGSQDPRNRVQPGGQSLAAWAKVIATPADPQSPPEELTKTITFVVQGPNKEWIHCQLLPFQDGSQLVQLDAKAPAAEALMQPGNPVLTALCLAGGQRLEAKLDLILKEELVLDAWAEGKKLAEIRYNDVSDPPGWFFGGITIYFHPQEDDSKVVPPPFQCNIDNPTFQIDPADILELSNYYQERPGWWTGEISLRDGVDLEKYFGPDLIDKDARIKLAVVVTGEGGQQYRSEITYQICPTVELAVFQCDENGTAISSRGDDFLNLGSLEFVADGQDYLNIMMYFKRTDWEEDSDRSVPFGSLLQVELKGMTSDEYKLGKDNQLFTPEPGRDAVWRTRVGSAKPLLDTPKRRGEKIGLRVIGGLQNVPVHYRFKTVDVDTGQDIVDLEFKPLFLYLGLWVVPGQERGTSTAGTAVFVCTRDCRLQLLPHKPELELLVNVKESSVAAGPDSFQAAGGFQQMDLSCEPLNYLVSTGGRVARNRIDLPFWLSAWKLRYSGLCWSNIDQGRFDVLCRFKDGEEAVVFSINVKENMAEMVAALDANASVLDLTNHEWQTYSLTGMFGILLARRECRGTIYNAREWIVTKYCERKGIPVPDEFRKYVCGAYSKRLRRYLIGRRNGTASPETALKMNGFEGCQYVLDPIHDWFGFHLSGTTPVQEPIFIDPWWTQEWNIDEIKDNYGFKMQSARFTAVLTLLLAELVLLGRFLWWMVRAGWKGFGLIYPLELSLADVYVILMELAKKWGWHLANILQNLATWYLQTPSNQDSQLFDDDLNYARFSELGLFESFKDSLLQTVPAPQQKIENWPKS